MPKDIIDYSKTVIYKIVCRNLDINTVYVGSTTDFTRRKSKPKSHSDLFYVIEVHLWPGHERQVDWVLNMPLELGGILNQYFKVFCRLRLQRVLLGL